MMKRAVMFSSTLLSVLPANFCHDCNSCFSQAVIRSNSFSEAAEECHISQSAISQQTQALEREPGFNLLERKNRRNGKGTLYFGVRNDGEL